MTNRDFLKAVVEANINEEMTTFANGLLTKLDEKNAKRKNTETKEQKENKILMGKILDLLATNPMVASEIGKALEVSTQKASALCTLLVKAGKVSVADIKVKGKGTVKQYTLIADEVGE